MQFQLLKVETQSVQVCWICTAFRFDQTQFGKVEVPSLDKNALDTFKVIFLEPISCKIV